MNKKLMAVAVAGAFGLPSLAFAQFSTPDGVTGSNASGSNVTIGGKLNFLYGYYSAGGAGNNIAGVPNTSLAAGYQSKLSGDAFNNSESELDIKGSENLGGGLSAWFQCGSSLDVTGGASGTGTGGLCGRNSAIGFKGNFGNVYGGNWDTSSKMAITPFTVFAQSYPVGNSLVFNGAASADQGNIAVPSTASAVAQSGGGANFWRRQSRLLTYITPVIQGFQASIGMSAANEQTAQTVGAGINKARLWSTGVNYSNGPLKLGVGYELHKNYNPGALSVTSVVNGVGNVTGNYAGGTDSQLVLGAQYAFMNNSVLVNAIWVNNNYQINGNLNMTQTNWTLNGAWNISGPHTIRLGYVNVGSTGGTYGAGGTSFAPATVGQMTANGGAGNTGAKKYQFEYAYAFSKRTEVSLGIAQVKNDAQSNILIGTGSTLPNFGETQSYYGLRMTHVF